MFIQLDKRGNNSIYLEKSESFAISSTSHNNHPLIIQIFIVFVDASTIVMMVRVDVDVRFKMVKASVLSEHKTIISGLHNKLQGQTPRSTQRDLWCE